MCATPATTPSRQDKRSHPFVLIPGRTSRQGTALNEGKRTDGYQRETGTLLMSVTDMQRLEIRDGQHVRLRSPEGSVEIPCRAGRKDELPEGVLFIPYGPTSSRLMGGDTQGTGMPDSKGLDVTLEVLSAVAEDSIDKAVKSAMNDASGEGEKHAVTTVENATCTFCGCVCDDMVLTVENKRITKAKNACVLGKAWFANHHIDEDQAEAAIDGQPATTAEAARRAAEILSSARYPIVYGLSDTTCEAQRVALGVADRVGACVDTTTSVCHGPSGMAFQGVGETTCTLGEVKNRADLVIFWGSNPADSHPRHFSKYSIMPKGRFVPRGRKDRTVVLVDVRKTKSAAAADIFIQVKPRRDFEVLWALRALVKGVAPDTAAVEEQTGVAIEVLEDLTRRMKTCKFGVLFFGMGLSMTRGKHVNAEAALALARDLNEFTRFNAKPMRGHGNVTGADNVVAWTTGYPFGVSLGRGYPRFNPGEFTTVDTLVRREADAALIIAADPMANFPQPAREHLARIPSIVLDPKISETGRQATVRFTTATYGINTAGTVYRMDDVPIPLRPAFESPFPSDEKVLRAIDAEVRKLVGPQQQCGTAG
jgi:formylmethanofuran dehydrogenase subunit B